MSVFDIHNKSTPEVALDLLAIATDTTTNGNIIDLKDFESVELLLSSGVITDGAYVFNLQHGDAANLSDAANVPDNDLLGVETDMNFALSEDQTVKKLGYIGAKRYIRMQIVSSATTTGGLFSGIAFKSSAKHQPV